MTQALHEILPGVHHWTARHSRIGREVSSYHLADARVLLDPMVPPEGVDWFANEAAPTDILLTNRHHYRQSGEFVSALGCTVRAPRPGMHEFAHGEPVEPYDFGDELPGGAVAHEVGAISPDDAALHLPDLGAIAFADGLVILDEDLGFVPDELMGDDPDGVRAGLLVALRRLLELPFEHLLLAHGGPVIGDGRARLERFVASRGDR